MAIVLGISPGTRTIGLAVFDDSKLLDWKMQSFQDAWSDQKLKAILHSISQYMDRNTVTSVAVKIPDDLPVSQNYIQLVGALNVLFERKGIQPMYYALSDLKKQYCNNGKSNKATLSYCIVSKHPELLPEYSREQTNRNSYYAKVFEAVASAHLHYVSLHSLPM